METKIPDNFAFSPSGYSVWLSDRRKWYCQYILGKAFFQTSAAMELGTAVDAIVKQELAIRMNAQQQNPNLERALVEQQERGQFSELVAPVAVEAAEFYINCGAFDALIADLGDTPELDLDCPPKMFEGVPIKGKPDLVSKSREGLPLVFDWKVSQFFDANNVRKKSEPQNSRTATRCWGNGRTKVIPCVVKGVEVNPDGGLPEDWKRQITFYAWLVGVPLGERFCGGIEKIMPGVVHQFREVVFPTYSSNLHSQLLAAWEAIQAGHYFTDMTYAESKAYEAAIIKEFEDIARPNDDLIEEQLRGLFTR